MISTSAQIVKDYSEFSGLFEIQILTNCQNCTEINKKDFEAHADSKTFYENSNTYIYDLLNANYDKEVLRSKINLFAPGFLPEIAFMGNDSFLEFGGGLGVMCELIKDINPRMKVTYCDIDTKISQFTKWRYDKYDTDIEFLIIPQDDFELPKKYNVIFTDAVIEHLPSEQQERYIKKLASYVETGGTLLLLIDLEGNNPNMPMHFDVDIVKLHNLVEESGMVCLSGRNTFSSKWINIKKFL